jgi:quinolinate synthase
MTNNHDEDLKKKIRTLLKKKNAVMLAHNYQRDEIQEIADYAGDSLGLSQTAAATKADIIVFCGVHFMAESAAILSPQKTVLLPNIEAGCPMADMVTPKKLREVKKIHSDAVVVCYINSSAEVKAESDICCTSSNVVKVVESLNGAEKVLMVPDMNLSNYAQRFTSKKLIPWKGFCPTHHNYIKAKDVQRVKEEHEDAVFMAHPECAPDILSLADHISSTSGMVKFARESPHQKIIVGTEIGIGYRLRKENPGKSFYFPSNEQICPNMKVTILEDVLAALEEEKHKITVPEKIREKAHSALQNMLSLS